ncbi:hypothetical protein ACFL4G_03965 [Thermodesulfobacteriota bacterium]
MKSLSWILIAFSAVGFVCASLVALWGFPDIGVSAKGFSYGCTNLALLAIALLLVSEKKGDNS